MNALLTLIAAALVAALAAFVVGLRQIDRIFDDSDLPEDL